MSDLAVLPDSHVSIKKYVIRVYTPLPSWNCIEVKISQVDECECVSADEMGKIVKIVDETGIDEMEINCINRLVQYVYLQAQRILQTSAKLPEFSLTI